MDGRETRQKSGLGVISVVRHSQSMQSPGLEPQHTHPQVHKPKELSFLPPLPSLHLPFLANSLEHQELILTCELGTGENKRSTWQSFLGV